MNREAAGVTASKEGDFSGWYTQVVLKAELADYAPVKGMMVLRPDGYAVWESLRAALDARLARRGVRNGFLPVLIPESLLGKEQSHFEGFNPEVFWVTHSGTGEIGDRLALRPTSETLAYTMYSKWIQSWRDLPLKMNFWNTALRAEIKGTKPFLRTSEFLWQEGHTVHADREGAEAEVAGIMEAYRDTVESELAVPVTVGRKSEKEKFVGAVYTTTMESVMPDGRALQMGTSHFLGQNFSVPFGVKFADRDNVEHFAWQTSWGVSWRLIGAMIMVHGDDRGLVLPPRVAPVQAVIIPIHGDGSMREGVLSAAEGARAALEAAGVRARVDSREGLTPGYKFSDWEMRGVPVRVEIGPRDVARGSAVVARRTGGKEDVPLSGIGGVARVLEEIQGAMLGAARERAAGMERSASGYGELKEAVAAGGFVSAPWCGRTECEEGIKEDTGADIRVIPFGSEDASSRCVRCGGASESVPVFARGY